MLDLRTRFFSTVDGAAWRGAGVALVAFVLVGASPTAAQPRNTSGCAFTMPQPFRLLESADPNAPGAEFPAGTRVQAIAWGTSTQAGRRSVWARIDTSAGWLFLWPGQLRACPEGSVAARPGDVNFDWRSPSLPPEESPSPDTASCPPSQTVVSAQSGVVTLTGITQSIAIERRGANERVWVLRLNPSQCVRGVIEVVEEENAVTVPNASSIELTAEHPLALRDGARMTLTGRAFIPTNGDVAGDFALSVQSAESTEIPAERPIAARPAAGDGAPSTLAPIAVTTPHSPEDQPRLSAAPWVLLGLGAATAASAGGLWLARNHAIGNCTIENGAIGCPTAADADRASSASTLGLGANLALLGGSTLVAIGSLWLLVRTNSSDGGERRTHRAHLAVFASSEGWGLSWGGAL